MGETTKTTLESPPDGFKQTGIGLIPEEWQVVSVADKYRFTKKPRGLRYEDLSEIPFVPMKLIPSGRMYFKDHILKRPEAISSGTYFEPNDILIPKITPSFENGKQGIALDLPTPFGIATTEVIPVAEIPGISDREYLFFYLLKDDVRSTLASKMEGSTGRQRLRKDLIEELRIPFPPLPEQRAIAHVLSKIQAAAEAQAAIAERARELKRALMAKLFTEGLRGEPLKVTEIGPMPDGWEVVKMGNTCEFLQYGTSERCDADTTGIPVLRIPNVIEGVIDLSELKFLKASGKTADRLRLKVGDLLIVRTNGRREYTGRCAIYKGEPGNALFASYLIRARLKPDSLLPDFVQLYTETDKGKEYLSGRASGAADGKFNINTQTIRAVLLPCPPLDEQREIARILQTVDARIAAAERKRASLEELFRALLRQLMTGRVRVRNLT